MRRCSSLQVAIATLAAALDLSASAAPGRVSSALAPMPEAVTSFGAVTCDGWLYVLGGHRGERHEYSADLVSGSFHRLDLSRGEAWEPLPATTPGQGQPLIAHNGRVYRIGGMAARNRIGDPSDLVSIAAVQRYDPRARRWEAIVPLPAPRSSHDAAMVGDRVFVAGGWQLGGGTNHPVWPAEALVLDLARPGSGWQQLPQPFRRRALALAAAGSRLYCIGGMNSDNQPTLAVDVFDTATGAWSKGPELPPGRHKGFACSAVAQQGRIFANSFQGDLLRLSVDGQSWEIVGRLNHPRLSHRLVDAGVTQLIALGGEDGDGKRPNLELLTPAPQPAGGAAPGKPARATASTTLHPHP